MKNSIILLILLFHISVKMYCQEKWSNLYLSGLNPFGESICEYYDKGYLIAGRYSANYPTLNWLIKTDINGAILWNKTFGNGIDLLVLTADIKISNEGCTYLTGSTDAYNNGNYDPIIMKLDSCGEKEWCKVFKAEGNNFINTLEISSNGSCIIVLRYMNPDITKDRICLAKLASDGELVWQKCFNSSDTSLYNADAYDITICPDGGYLISGVCDYQDSSPPHYLWLKPYYIKTDSLGNFEWEKVINTETNLPGGSAWSTVLNLDSTYFYSSISHYLSTSGNAPALVKMNLQGEVIAVYDLAPPNHYGKLFESVFISDSTLAGSANWGSEEHGVPKAVIFDTLGNILDSAFLLDNHYLSYVRKTFDNKLLFFTNIYNEGTDQFDAYLFKLNQNLEDDTFYTFPFQYDTLCPYPIASDTITQEGCDIIVGIEEEDEEMGREGDGERMELFPNPATDQINCRLQIADCRSSLLIYDMFGRKQEEIQIPKGQKMIQLDVSDYPQRIYIAVLRSEREILDRKKFVVQ